MLYYWTGDAFLLQQKLVFWKESFREKHGMYSVESTDSFHGFLDALQAHDFFSQKRMVVYTGPALKDHYLQHALETKDLQDLFVIIVDFSVDKRTSAYKQLSKHAEHEHKELTIKTLHSFITEESKKRGIRFVENAQSLFEITVGAHSAECVQELEKLSLLGRPISEKDVQMYTNGQVSLNVFALTDALNSGKKIKAHECLQELESLQESPHKIFLMLVKHIRTLYVACDYADTLHELGVHPFVIQKLKGAKAYYTSSSLKIVLSYCIQLDTGIKTGLFPASNNAVLYGALHTLIAKML